MNVGEALKARILDRAAQRQTQANVDAFRKGWGPGPIHRRFDDAMASLPSSATAEQVAEAVRTLFADHGWVDTLVSALAGEMLADPFFDPPFRHLISDVHARLL